MGQIKNIKLHIVTDIKFQICHMLLLTKQLPQGHSHGASWQ